VDKIAVEIEALPWIVESVQTQSDYIASQVLARSVVIAPRPAGRFTQTVEIDERQVGLAITKL
jgi:hypothetical protein